MTQTNLPKPGQYRDQLGRTMIDQSSTGGAWEAREPTTDTGKHARAIVAHRTSDGRGAHYDGAIDAKAMKELVALGKKEGLIQVGRDGRVKNLDAFLEAIRPFQLDFCKEGADALRRLMAQAGESREFFEVSSQWPAGQVWSDARANQKLTDRLLGKTDSGGGDVTIQIVGEGQDGGGGDVTIQIVGEGQDGGGDVTIQLVGEGQDGGGSGITAFQAGLGPESQS